MLLSGIRRRLGTPTTTLPSCLIYNLTSGIKNIHRVYSHGGILKADRSHNRSSYILASHDHAGDLRTGTPISQHDFSSNFSHYTSRRLRGMDKEVPPQPFQPQTNCHAHGRKFNSDLSLSLITGIPKVRHHTYTLY